MKDYSFLFENIILSLCDSHPTTNRFMPSSPIEIAPVGYNIHWK